MYRLLDFSLGNDVQNLGQLRHWFSDQAQLKQWAGSDLDLNLSDDDFLDQVCRAPFRSFGLMHGLELIAFGQFYQRLDYCHLCRLAVAPEQRGKGVLSILIDELFRVGSVELSTDKASLFVYPDNEPALRAYQKLGFRRSVYPGNEHFPDCIYMLKSY